MTASALYEGLVTHERFAPKRHRLRYRLFQMLLDLDNLADLDRDLKLFSLDRFNLFSFHARDHGDGRADLRAYVRELLATAGIAAGGPIRLLCMPRILGHAFNPISIYYCHRADGTVAAVLYEVNNTFGERHAYLIAAEGSEGGTIRQACDKRFYVSPFMDMAMGYDFRLTLPAERISTTVHGDDPQGRRLITATFAGARKALSDKALMLAFLAYPLMTLKVVAAIHWEALQIFAKGVGFRARPTKPEAPVTMVAVAIREESRPAPRTTRRQVESLNA
jgi:DUF1365 family protein